jgi:hypothetical protein
VDGNNTVVIQGILFEMPVGSMLQVCQVDSVGDQLQVPPSDVSPEGVPTVVFDLLSKYADVFATKVAFPPPRSCSHSIPLIPSARPVSIRPYRYAPILKDEIEIHVQEIIITIIWLNQMVGRE